MLKPSPSPRTPRPSMRCPWRADFSVVPAEQRRAGRYALQLLTQRPELLGRALHRLFVEGRLDRGEFKAMIDSSDRTASRVISSLLEQRLVVSPSRAGHLEPGFPFFSFRFLFPGLWPEAEGIVSVPGNLVSKEKHS